MIVALLDPDSKDDGPPPSAGAPMISAEPSRGEAKTIVQIIASHAQTHPDRIACVFQCQQNGRHSITFQDLWSRSQSFASWLKGQGADAGEPLIIVLRHCPEMLYAFFGAMIAGMVPAFMPFPTAKQKRELFWSSHRSLFLLIGAKRFLTYSDNATLVESVPEKASVWYVETIGAAFCAKPATFSAPLPDAVALLQHTSGTTGLKKGVALSHRAVLKQIEAYTAAIGFGPDDVIASWLPLYHDMGLVACLMMPVLAGAKVVFLDPFEWVVRPTILLDCIENDRATFSWLPNFAFLHMAGTAPPALRWDLSSIRALINCSEPCKPTSFERFRERFGGCGLRPNALQVCYAMAETVFAVTQTPLDATPRTLTIDPDGVSPRDADATLEPGARGLSVLSCGKPIAETFLCVVKPDRTPVDAGEIGEIAVRSANLFSGYNKMPQVTVEKTSGDWYFTGDLGLIDGGELFVTGRKDDLIIVYGRNYYAHAVEQVASDCPGVLNGRAVAFSIENEVNGSRDAVLLVEADGTHLERDLRRFVKARVLDLLGLSLYSVMVYSRGTLIKSTSGKISRDQNKRIYLDERGRHEQRRLAADHC